MEKAKNIFYKVSIILSIILIVLYAILIVVCFIGGILAIVGMVAGESTGTASPDDASGLAALGALGFVYAFLLILPLVFSIVNLIICKKAVATPSKKLYILSIVFGAISGAEFSIPAGILGLIQDSQTNNNSTEEKAE